MCMCVFTPHSGLKNAYFLCVSRVFVFENVSTDFVFCSIYYYYMYIVFINTNVLQTNTFCSMRRHSGTRLYHNTSDNNYPYIGFVSLNRFFFLNLKMCGPCVFLFLVYTHCYHILNRILFFPPPPRYTYFSPLSVSRFRRSTAKRISTDE